MGSSNTVWSATPRALRYSGNPDSRNIKHPTGCVSTEAISGSKRFMDLGRYGPTSMPTRSNVKLAQQRKGRACSRRLRGFCPTNRTSLCLAWGNSDRSRTNSSLIPIRLLQSVIIYRFDHNHSPYPNRRMDIFTACSSKNSLHKLRRTLQGIEN